MSHALLAPSSAHRWLTCTPSALLEASVPDKGSPYASEGTLAHEIVEAKVLLAFGKINEYEYQSRIAKASMSTQFDEEMQEHAKAFIDHLLVDVMSPDTFFLEPEIKVNLEWWVKDCYGTADVIAFDGTNIIVADYKYGKGVRVDVQENEQLMLYALGAYKFLIEFGVLDNKSVCANELTAQMWIYQPRNGGLTKYEKNMGDLVTWAEKYVAPRAAMAQTGLGEFMPTEKACRFCRIKAECKGLQQSVLGTMELISKPIATMTLEEASDALVQASMFMDWYTSLEQHVHDALMSGKSCRDWKLVQGRGRRVITDEPGAGRLLLSSYKHDEVYTTKLKGITELSKLMGKKNFDEKMAPYMSMKAASPVMVRSTDPRPAYDTTAGILEAFDNVCDT